MKKTTNYIWLMLVTLSIAFACGDVTTLSKGNKAKAEQIEGAKVVESLEDLPACTSSELGALYYVIEMDSFQYCNGKVYTNINLTGPQGPIGQIIWLGELSTSPGVCNASRFNQAYYNSTVGGSFLCTDNEWKVISKDGAFAVSAYYTIAGSVSGLGGGKTLVLDVNDGSESKAVTANGSFAFSTIFDPHVSYFIKVLTQPVGQFCDITGYSNAYADGYVNEIEVDCVNTYPVTLTSTGIIMPGVNLTVYSNEGEFGAAVPIETVQVTSNGLLNLTSTLKVGTAYKIIIDGTPSLLSCSSNPSTVFNAVTDSSPPNATLTCINLYSVSVNVTGLNPGNTLLLLPFTGGSAATITSNGTGTFNYKFGDGQAYDVTVTTPWPTYQSCSVTNGTGTISSANVTNVNVTCGNAPKINITETGLLSPTTVYTYFSATSVPIGGIQVQVNTPHIGTAYSMYIASVTNSRYASFCTLDGGPYINGTYTLNTDVNLNLTCVPNVIDNADGTVTIRTVNGADDTNLTWKKCLHGHTDDATCSGTPTPVQFCSTANDNCNGGFIGGDVTSGALYNACNTLNSNPPGGYAGLTTWRVPTSYELSRLRNSTYGYENQGLFPNYEPAAAMWTSESSTNTQSKIVASNGAETIAHKMVAYPVRCVAD